MLGVDDVPAVLCVVVLGAADPVRAAVVQLILDVSKHAPLYRGGGELVLVHHPVGHPVVTLVPQLELGSRPRPQGVRAAGERIRLG